MIDFISNFYNFLVGAGVIAIIAVSFVIYGRLDVSLKQWRRLSFGRRFLTAFLLTVLAIFINLLLILVVYGTGYAARLAYFWVIPPP